MKKLLFILLLSSCTPTFDKVEPTIEQPTNSRISIADAKANTILALQNAGIWSQLDMLQVRVDTSLTNAVYYSDWIDTSRHPISYGTIGAFYVNGGIKGSSTYRINTMYNPYTDGVNFTQDNNSFGVYVGNRVIENKTDLSALQTGTIGCEVQSTSTSPSIYAFDNNATIESNPNDIGRGLHAVKRTASNLWTSVVGGYPDNTFTGVSSPIVNQPMWEYCRAINTTYSKYTTRTHYFIFAGSGNIDLFLFNSIMEEYYLIPLGLCPTKRITFLGNSYTASRLYVRDALVSLNDYNNLDLNVVGLSGYTTPQLRAKAYIEMYPFNKNYLTKDVVVIWELTNDMSATGGNQDSCYAHMVSLCQDVRTNMPSAKIIVLTMMPRNARPTRQNDSDLFDDNTLNGMVRNRLVQDGYADYICDTGSDTLMGKAGQNTNLDYYKADQIHPNAVGYQRLNDLYIYPSLTNAGL